jgi:hypothetical protein
MLLFAKITILAVKVFSYSQSCEHAGRDWLFREIAEQLASNLPTNRKRELHSLLA